METEKTSEVLDFIFTLCKRGIKLETFTGVQVDSMYFHYSYDFVRFKHLLGLSDAVHLSMFNLNIQVKFPGQVALSRKFSIDPSCRVFLKCEGIRFTGHDSRMTMVVNRPTVESRQLRLILHYLRKFPKGLSETEYVKLIKNSLVHLFCSQMCQELPPEKERRVEIFPQITQERLNRLFSRNTRMKCRFYKNLLEAKSICAEVGVEMVKEAYEKHCRSLCRPPEEVPIVPETILQELYQYGQEVGKFVEKVYDPRRTKTPNTRATIEKSREKGGAREALQPLKEVQRGPLFLDQTPTAVRPEPFVIALFGPPGSGKTTMVAKLRQLLFSSLFSSGKEVKDSDQVYSRSCSTEHWDGYTGQPIVILDDFGQNRVDRSDIVEFEQLVSVNRYVVPMAELENKGRCFTSPIIILTSNMSYGSAIRTPDNRKVVEDDLAVWRRMHLPVLLLKDKNDRLGDLKEIKVFNRSGLVGQPVWSTTWMEKYLGENYHLSDIGWGDTALGAGRSLFQNNTPRLEEKDEDLFSLFSRCVKEFRLHIDYHEEELSSYWRQTVTKQRISVKQLSAPFYSVYSEKIGVSLLPSDVTVSQVFPRFPPYHPPVVQAIAIKEPLKVRMITKAEAETKVLQPFQWALFEYLKTQPQFSLTHGVSRGFDGEFEDKLAWIYRIESEIQSILSRSSDEDELWLSGDYSSATDDFPMSVTNALIEGILSQISHEPTKMWVRYEVSPHHIRYPGGKVGKQTCGQLMGSLLSFPLLCFLNDYVISRSGFKKGSYMINGDDVVARGTLSNILRWKELCPKVNLTLSQGKNFVHPKFCTVNSQLFWEGTVQHTGKVSCQTRHGKTLSRCYSEVQFYYGNHDRLRREFIRRNLHELRECPSSLDIPISHGGLGLVWSHRPGVDMALGKRVYLAKYLQPLSKSHSVPGYDFLRALPVPVGLFTQEEYELGGGLPQSVRTLELLQSLEDPRDSTSRDFSQADLRLYQDQTKTFTRLKNKLHQFPLKQFPPLGVLRYEIIYIAKDRVTFLKKKSLQVALDLLLDYLLQGGSGADSMNPDIIWEEYTDEIINRENIESLFDGLEEEEEREFVEEFTTDDQNRYQHLLPGITPVRPKISALPHDRGLQLLLSQPTELESEEDKTQEPEFIVPEDCLPSLVDLVPTGTQV
nr:MAG: putative RNA-dependent RNA polymerase [Narnaviridae sp.]